MKYFRSFQLVGTEAIDEYYNSANKLAQSQQELFKILSEDETADVSTQEKEIGNIYKDMYKKYGMIPDLLYHAMAEKGYVSTLLNKKEYKQKIKSGEVKKGTARELELLIDDKKESAFSVPVLQINDPHSIRQFEQTLMGWQKLKTGISQAQAEGKKDIEISLTEQYEAACNEMIEKYKLDPAKQFVFETTTVGVYLACDEEELHMLAGVQKKKRVLKFREFLDKKKTSE